MENLGKGAGWNGGRDVVGKVGSSIRNKALKRGGIP
jgi:hypothetical protein